MKRGASFQAAVMKDKIRPTGFDRIKRKSQTHAIPVQMEHAFVMIAAGTLGQKKCEHVVECATHIAGSRFRIHPGDIFDEIIRLPPKLATAFRKRKTAGVNPLMHRMPVETLMRDLASRRHLVRPNLRSRNEALIDPQRTKSFFFPERIDLS